MLINLRSLGELSVLDQILDPDVKYGRLRPPTEVRRWEKNCRPTSLTLLDEECGKALAAFATAAQSNLVGTSCSALLFIWAMDAECRIWIAVEEVSPWHRPRLAGVAKLKQFNLKKLGHPTLVNGGMARIAGELMVEPQDDGRPRLVLNQSSGRYCEEIPASDEQLLAILECFVAVVGNIVELDEEP